MSVTHHMGGVILGIGLGGFGRLRPRHSDQTKSRDEGDDEFAHCVPPARILIPVGILGSL